MKTGPFETSMEMASPKILQDINGDGVSDLINVEKERNFEEGDLYPIMLRIGGSDGEFGEPREMVRIVVLDHRNHAGHLDRFEGSGISGWDRNPTEEILLEAAGHAARQTTADSASNWTHG